jgi:predicted RNase H-like HicB family nuclease
MKRYKVVIHDAEEGGYWAEAPELPGCVTEADTFEELQVNIREAIALWPAFRNEQKLRSRIISWKSQYEGYFGGGVVSNSGTGRPAGW